MEICFQSEFLRCSRTLLLGAKLSEYHTGYRAFARNLLAQLPLEDNSDDFLFDNQILVQVIALGYPIGEVTSPNKVFPGGLFDWFLGKPPLRPWLSRHSTARALASHD